MTSLWNLSQLQKKYSSPCHHVQRLTCTVARKRGRFSGIARIAPGSSGEDARTVRASYATTPRAIRAIPENRPRFRATVSVASLERENGHFSANRRTKSCQATLVCGSRDCAFAAPAVVFLTVPAVVVEVCLFSGY